MASQLLDHPLIRRVIEKFSNSRDFTISFILHVILVAVFGTAVLFEAVNEPPDFEGGEGGFVSSGAAEVAPPSQAQTQPQETTFTVTTTPTTTASAITPLTTTAPNPLSFTMTPVITPTVATTTAAAPQPAAMNAANRVSAEGMSTAVASQIKAFTGGWGKGQGSGTGIRSREFEFTAFIGQYQGGNWNSTVQVTQNRITGGSLPNLLYIINKWSRDKIKTNERNVRAIRLDSDELFSAKPPFIFITGTRDFVLTDKEVQNLQKYVMSGGAIWGDSSVPGHRSRFDIAFRREMKRVIPDVDKEFEPLPANHPIFTQGYFNDVKEVPPGLNFYKEPVYALKIFGEIAILYTANDYGDMWQIGINEKGELDMRRNERGQYLAINTNILNYRDIYMRNIEPAALVASYKFGTNIILHLLTRWESKVSRAPTL